MAVPEVAGGPGVGLDPTHGLGLGQDLVLVVLESVLAKLKVAVSPGVGLNPASGLVLEVVLAVHVVAAGPGVGLDPTRGLGLIRALVLVELEDVLPLVSIPPVVLVSVVISSW